MSRPSPLRAAFQRHAVVADCPIYDLHGHMGPFAGAHFPRNSPAEMVEVMGRAGVRMLVFCSHGTLFSPEIDNTPNIEAVRQFPDRLRAYCGVNGNYPDLIRRNLRQFERYRDVYVGFKLLADYHQVAITDDRYRPVWECADALGLLVLLHTWAGSPYNGPDHIRKIAGTYGRVKLLLGHSCHGDWDKAIQLARDFPNVHLELTAVPDERGVLELFLEKAGAAKMVFGTDFPWFNHHYYIGAVLGSGASDADCRLIFHGNAQRLLRGLSPAGAGQSPW